MRETARKRASKVVTTEAIEDYVKAIYSLERAARGPVSNSALAERLGVTAGSASGMVKKLDGLRLVRHVPYRGVELTARGRRLALEVLRHHRLLELYLTEAFDMPWDQVHAEAEKLEHVLSEELEELIAAKLAIRPSIRTVTRSRDLMARSTSARRLAGRPRGGDRALSLRVSDSDPEMLRYLAERDIRPGQRLRGDRKAAVRRATAPQHRREVAYARAADLPARCESSCSKGRQVRAGRADLLRRLTLRHLTLLLA